MTKYASYSVRGPQPVPVAAWYDSCVARHLDFSQPGFMPVSEAQWAARHDKIWAVAGGGIVEYVAPAQSLDNAQQSQARKLTTACQQLIVSGFASSALGAVHNYASTAIDQRNLILAAQSSKGGVLSCQDTTGAWARVMHTQTQAQHALEDFVAMAGGARTKLSAREAQIANATNVADVQDVAWDA